MRTAFGRALQVGYICAKGCQGQLGGIRQTVQAEAGLPHGLGVDMLGQVRRKLTTAHRAGPYCTAAK
jgi:hypothetical protein